MEKKCTNCQSEYEVNPRARNQRYCGGAQCQRARKRNWQKEKLRRDKEYRENQAEAQRQWAARNPGYWKDYRGRNPEYVKSNRQKQRERNARRGTVGVIAKMDESEGKSAIKPGRYKLIPLSKGEIAKMDAYIVEIGVISRDCGDAVSSP